MGISPESRSVCPGNVRFSAELRYVRTRAHDVQLTSSDDASPDASTPGLELVVVQSITKERATGLEPATSSLGR